MKIALSFIILLSFTICNAQEVLFFNEEPDKYDESIITHTIGSDKNLLTFTSNFDNNLVKIIIENDSIFSGYISTDHTIGAAKGVDFDRYCTSIEVVINKEKLHLKNSSDYRFIYIMRKKEKYIIEYRKKPIKFG